MFKSCLSFLRSWLKRTGVWSATGNESTLLQKAPVCFITPSYIITALKIRAVEYPGNRQIASSSADKHLLRGRALSHRASYSYSNLSSLSGDPAESGSAQVPAAIGSGVEEFFLVTRMLLVRG